MNSLFFRTFNCFNVFALILVIGSFLSNWYEPLESITPEEFHLVEKIHENSYKKSFELTKKRHIRKFNELISKNKVPQSITNITDKKRWVINMSSRQLTHIETDLLAKVLNFSITSETLPNKDIIATIEDPVKDLEKEESDMIRAKVSLTLQNCKPTKDNLPKNEAKLWMNYNLIDQL